MSAKHRFLLLLIAPCLGGCMSFSMGNRQFPTLADEIRDLKKLRDQGTISEYEYELGKTTLLRSHHQTEFELPASG